MKDFFIFALGLLLIMMSIMILAILFELIYESDFYQHYKVVRKTKKWRKEYGKDTWGADD